MGSWKDPGSSNCRQCLLPQRRETRRGLGIVKTQRLGGSSPFSWTQTPEKTAGVWAPGPALESALWTPGAGEAALVNVRKPVASYCHYPGQGQPVLPGGEAACKAVQVGSKPEEASPFFLLLPLAESSSESADKTEMRFEAPQFQHLKENTREGLEVRLIAPQPGRGGHTA